MQLSFNHPPAPTDYRATHRCSIQLGSTQHRKKLINNNNKKVVDAAREKMCDENARAPCQNFEEKKIERGCRIDLPTL